MLQGQHLAFLASPSDEATENFNVALFLASINTAFEASYVHPGNAGNGVRREKFDNECKNIQNSRHTNNVTFVQPVTLSHKIANEAEGGGEMERGELGRH